MDAVFTLQWPELVVAEKLRKLLPRKDGYSILIPLSRQEEGIDLAVLRRRRNNPSKTTTIQVKASRTYSSLPPKRTKTVRFQFETWFNRFDVPGGADLVILCAMYPPDPGRTTPVSAKWYKDCSLLFTNKEMRTFMKNCKTVEGKPDRMFGFGFNGDLSEVIQTRGDSKRRGRDFKKHLLDRKISELKKR